MKYVFVIFALMISVSAFACGGSDKSADSSPTTSTESESESSGWSRRGIAPFLIC